MAKKPEKGKKSGESSPPKHRRTSRPIEEDQDDLPVMGGVLPNMEADIAALQKLLQSQEFSNIDDANEFLQNLLGESGGQIPRKKPETPLEKAQDLIYQAQETPDIKKAIRLAKQALKHSKDCADAYTMLGDLEAESPVQAIPYYEQAVAAGERAIGKDRFEEARGHFWGIIETRPYMRARSQLANALWELGQPDAAIAHYREMLELNPGDNQGIRYLLLHALMQIYRNDEAEALLDQFDDGMAIWLYNRALLNFRKHGRSAIANEALEEAFEQNEFIPEYLLGFEEMPLVEDMPLMHSWGDEDEAILYALKGMILWAQTPGAQHWLAEQFLQD
jgi:tetratricopeptide (TPR) repeat protein